MMTRIPWRLIGYAALALLLIFGANNALRFIPFTPQWSAARTAAKAERLEGQVSTLEREATGQAEISTATEIHHTREIIIRETAAQSIAAVRNEPDADTPIAAGRAGLFRGHDDSLCVPPAPCGTIADLAGRGQGAVPPADPAG